LGSNRGGVGQTGLGLVEQAEFVQMNDDSVGLGSAAAGLCREAVVANSKVRFRPKRRKGKVRVLYDSFLRASLQMVQRSDHRPLVN